MLGVPGLHAMPSVTERTNRLEETLQTFIGEVGAQFKNLYKSQMKTEAELRVFKDDVQAFKNEMLVFKDEMLAFQNEMRDFKDEMRSFRNRSEREHREMNRRWGELANKMGTMVEDLVAPSLPRIIRECFDLEVTDLMPRRRKKFPDGRIFEFDAIAVTDKLVALNSTKSTLRGTDVDGFVAEIAQFREVFPEYAEQPVVGILASLAVDDNVLNRAEKLGFLVLAVGDQVMEVKNRPGFQPKRW